MDQTERNIEVLKSRVEKRAAELRDELTLWIDRLNGQAAAGEDPRDSGFRGPYVEITRALLETAIDRMLALHGGPDARAFVLDAFERQLAAYKRTLQ